MVDGRNAVAQASVQLLGSLLELDKLANAVNLAIALTPARRKSLESSVRGQLTQKMKHQFRSLPVADREAALSNATETLRGVRADEELARHSKDPALLKRRLIARKPEPARTVESDPAAGPCFQALMDTACEFIAKEIRLSGAFTEVILDETVRDVTALHRKTDWQGSKIEKLDSRLRGLTDDIKAVSLQVPIILSRVPGIDDRPRPKVFVGRHRELALVSAVLERASVVEIWGQPMTGRYELARQWCLLHEYEDRTWVIDCGDYGGFEGGVEALARKFGVPAGSVATLTLERVMSSPTDVSIILTNVGSEDLLKQVHSLKIREKQKIFAILDFVPEEGRDAYSVEVKPLSQAEILEILQAEFREPVSDLETLAQRLEGLPLVAKQAASLIKEAGLSAQEFSGLLSERTDFALRQRPGIERRSRDAAGVWEASLRQVESKLGQPVRVCFGVLRIFGGAAIEGAWQGAIAYMLTNTRELAQRAEVLVLTSALRRSTLIAPAGSVVSAPPLLIDYFWATMNGAERRRAATACLNIGQLAASIGRTSNHAGAMNAVAWLLFADLEELRNLDSDLFDEVVPQVALLFHQLDIVEDSMRIHWKLIELMDADQDANPLRIATNLGFLMWNEEVRDAADYVETLFDEFYAEAEGLALADLHCLVAYSRWMSGRLPEGRDACIAAQVTLLDVPPDDDRLQISIRVNYYLGQFQIALGSHQDGLHSFRAALAEVESDSRFKLQALTLRAEVAKFLGRQGVVPPEDLRFDSSSVSAYEDAQARAGIVGVTGGLHIAASQAAKSQGEVVKAFELLGDSPLVGFGNYYSAFARAEHLQHRARASIDLLDDGDVQETGVLIPANTGRINEILHYLDEGLKILRELPHEQWATSRVKRLRSGLQVNKAETLLLMGRGGDGILLARDSVTIDAEEFGTDHSEYAHDSITLAHCLLSEGNRREARQWLTKARKVYRSRGRHHDANRARHVSDLLG